MTNTAQNFKSRCTQFRTYFLYKIWPTIIHFCHSRDMESELFTVVNGIKTSQLLLQLTANTFPHIKK